MPRRRWLFFSQKNRKTVCFSSACHCSTNHYVFFMHTVFYSTSWINPAAPPLWYYMNHSSLPNVVMRIANPDGPVPQQRLVWVAVRDIAAGDEIRFYYFDAPASWV
jgi:hypothetical protein